MISVKIEFWCGERTDFELFRWLASSPLQHSRTAVRVCDSVCINAISVLTQSRRWHQPGISANAMIVRSAANKVSVIRYSFLLLFARPATKLFPTHLLHGSFFGLRMFSFLTSSIKLFKIYLHLFYPYRSFRHSDLWCNGVLSHACLIPYVRCMLCMSSATMAWKTQACKLSLGQSWCLGWRTRRLRGGAS